VNIWYFWVWQLRPGGSCSKFLILLFETSLLIESRTDLQVVRLIWPIWTRDSHVALLAQFQFCKLCKKFNSYSIKALIKTHWQWQKPKPQNLNANSSAISRSVNSGNIYHVTSSVRMTGNGDSVIFEKKNTKIRFGFYIFSACESVIEISDIRHNRYVSVFISCDAAVVWKCRI